MIVAYPLVGSDFMNNSALLTDLIKLWRDCQLTEAHRLMLRPCPNCRCNGFEYAFFDHDVQYAANDHLYAQMGQIWKRYKCDLLDSWIADKRLWFVRTLSGLTYDSRQHSTPSEIF